MQPKQSRSHVRPINASYFLHSKAFCDLRLVFIDQYSTLYIPEEIEVTFKLSCAKQNCCRRSLNLNDFSEKIRLGNSHKISSLIFSEKYENEYFVCCSRD